MRKKQYLTIVLAACTTMILSGCFDLEEHVYSEVTENSFNPTPEDVASLLASTYLPLTEILDWQGYFDLQEESGDVIITPTRPDGWDDNGVYRRMHQHTWTSESWQPENVYEICYSGINNANRILDQIVADELPVGNQKESIMAELRAIRAYWYSILIDTHGNVPIVTTFSDVTPKQSARKEVYDFIVSELMEVIPQLSEKTGNATYGRMNKWAANMVLARIYLNAEVYTGTPQWEKALACADAVISSGCYTLCENYSDNFSANTDASNPEVIFAVPFDNKYAGFHLQHKWYPSEANEVFGNPSDYFWDGSCANPQFINAYEEGDKRLSKTWLMGPQYSAKDPTKLLWTCRNYLPSLTCSKDGKSYASSDYGYRVFKFGLNLDSPTGAWSNDFPIIRYAETLMTKAECLLRLGRSKQEAADLVTSIRQRVFDDPAKAKVTVERLEGDTRIHYGTLDWDNNIDKPGDQIPVKLGGLYDEWGFEFACEAQRRTHMIRFGTYTTKNWFNHEAITDGHTAIFPIPLDYLESNPNLKQNPGY